MAYSLNNNKYPISYNKTRCLLVFVLCIPLIVLAQDRDTNYIEPYTKMITGRVFLSQKYTIFSLEGSNGSRELQYRPNTKLDIGLGATYRAINLSIGYGFDLIDQEKEKGETKYLDLQTHLYGIKWGFDLFGQFYKGYYAFPKGYAADDKENFYKRPDLHVQEIGVSAFHIYNNKRFSYRAAFLQSEWQKKSAGSFLLGGSIVYGNIDADSAFVPSELANNYQQKNIKALRYLEMGPGAGYSYTFVIKEHWYISASSTLSLNLGLIKEITPDEVIKSSDISPHILFRIGTGYNSGNWNVNFAWVSNRTAIKGQFRDGGYNVNTGNYRLSVGKRFNPGKGLKKPLRLIDKVLDNWMGKEEIINKN